MEDPLKEYCEKAKIVSKYACSQFGLNESQPGNEFAALNLSILYLCKNYNLPEETVRGFLELINETYSTIDDAS